jgi:hypothetical protein
MREGRGTTNCGSFDNSKAEPFTLEALKQKSSPRLSISSMRHDYRMNDPARKASNSHKRWHIKGGQDNPMRNVIFAINTTLDGCVDHTKMIADETMLEHYMHLLRGVDLLVYGRKLIN